MTTFSRQVLVEKASDCEYITHIINQWLWIKTPTEFTSESEGKCVWGSDSTWLTASSVCSHIGTFIVKTWSPLEWTHSWKTDDIFSCKPTPAEGARFWFRAIKAARFLWNLCRVTELSLFSGDMITLHRDNGSIVWVHITEQYDSLLLSH